MDNYVIKDQTPLSNKTENYVWLNYLISSSHLHCYNIKTCATPGDMDNLYKNQCPEKIALFKHGVGGSSYIWHKQIDFFINLGYVVYMVDLLGHGESSLAESFDDYNFSNLSKDCLLIFDRVRSCNINIVIGHSYGCAMAALIAHERQDLVYRLVLISGGSARPLAPIDKLFTLPLCIMQCIHPLLLYLFRKKTFSNKKENESLKKRAININSFVFKAVMQGQIWQEGDFRYHQDIKVPTLLLHGMDDQIVNYYEESDMQLAITFCCLKCIYGAGHYCMLEDPDNVNKLIGAHIDEDWGSRPPKYSPDPLSSSVNRQLSIRDQFKRAASVLGIIQDNDSLKYDVSFNKTVPSGLIIRGPSKRIPKSTVEVVDHSVANIAMEEVD